MPATEVLYYRDEDGNIPVLQWLEDLEKKNKRAFKKCVVTIELLRDFGHELRRPTADLLEDGVYELRARVGKVNYRILYGFVGKDVALLTAGLTKEKKIPSAEIKRAAARLAEYKRDSAAHGFREEVNDDG